MRTSLSIERGHYRMLPIAFGAKSGDGECEAGGLTEATRD
jgi:hypothetical protein